MATDWSALKSSHDEIAGPRQTFLLMGLPGIILALIQFLTVRDVQVRRVGPALVALPHVATSLRVMLGRPALFLAASGGGLSIFASQALLNWFSGYMMRFYGLSPREIVLKMGLLAVISGGSVSRSEASSLMCWRANLLRTARLAEGAIIAALPMGILAVSGVSQQQTFVWSAAYVLVAGFVTGPAFAMVQNVAPLSLRSFAAVVVFLIAAQYIERDERAAV